MKQIKNSKAYFDFDILEEEIAGMMLNTPTVKKIASGQFSITGNYVKIVSDEVFLIGDDSDASIKLLLTKKQINRYIGKVKEKGLTIVPLEVTISNGKFKLKIGLAKGKKEYDKRATDKSRDMDLEARRVVKSQKFSGE
jgi:SsrA-binding protein